MKPRYFLVPLVALLLLGNAPPPIPPLTAEELDSFLEYPTHRSYPMQPLEAWEADLRRALAGADPDRAADALAPLHGLSAAHMRELVRLWLIAQVRAFDPRPNFEVNNELRRRLLDLLAASGRSPLVFQAVAESLNGLAECSGEDFAAMIAGSADPAADAWAIAGGAECSDNFLRAASADPARSMPGLIRLAHYGSLEPRDALPVYQWLISPERLARISGPQRPALTALLHARYARLLFAVGLTDQAVALIDALPADLRRLVLDPPRNGFTAIVDGLPVSFEAPGAEEAVKLDLAVAFALAGRTAEAEALLFSMPLLAAARRAFDCSWQDEDTPAASCGNIPYEQSLSQTIDLLVLDHFLHRPQEDPYPLAEAGLARGHADAAGAAVAELRCRLFGDPQFGHICRAARSALWHRLRLAPLEYRAQEDARLRSGLAALLPDFGEARAALLTDFSRLIAAAGADAAEPDFTRASVTPAPPPFAERPLPGAFSGLRPSATSWPRDLAALPEGFVPVRFERGGVGANSVAVAVSLSQIYDPVGELSGGGYWVHLSRDGGRSWEPPLYTGLAQFFPYHVPETSLMPLLSGDHLDLEVEVAELDTASITYPPVGLRTRRRASGLYLRIPLAGLARDSDGDGFTDLAERNLLLDRARGDGGGPFIVGSDGGIGCGAPDRDRLALAGLLGQMFSVSAAALIEPVDRPPGQDPLVLPVWRRVDAAPEQPLFLRGDPAHFRCLNPDRLMIVYGEDDIAQLERFRPDFHSVTLPRIVYNRARDRGYAIWSAGWTGGTLRLRLVDGRWAIDTISSWIT